MFRNWQARMKEKRKNKLLINLLNAKDYFFVIFTVLVFISSIYLWRFLDLQEEKNYKNLIKVEANIIANLLTNHLNESISSLERLKSRWEEKLYLNKNQWLNDTTNYLAHKQELMAIEWVDKKYIVRWINPLPKNNKAQDLDLTFEEKRKKALDLAKISKKTQITQLIDFVQGGKGFLSASPVFVDGEFDGFVLGVFEINQVLKSFINSLAKKNITIKYINIKDQEFKEDPFLEKNLNLWIFNKILKFRNLHIGAQFYFGNEYIVPEINRFSNIVGMSGIFLSFIMGILIYFNKELKNRSDSLAKEIQEKDKIAIELERSEKQIRLIADSVTPLISYINLDGCYEFNSKRYEEWFQIPINKITGLHVKELIGQEAYKSIEKYLKTAFLGKSAHFEKLIHFPNGKQRFIRGEFIPDRSLGIEVLGVFAVITDITDLKNYEEELKNYRLHLENILNERTAELEKTHKQLIHAEKLSATGKLAAIMAHEINNPICGIRNVLEIVNERSNLRKHELLITAMAIKECNRIIELVKNLNDFHRPSPGNYELKDVNALINELLVLENKILKKKNIELTKSLALNLPKISLITDQIKQVILNLLINAEDSMSENKKDGKISITTGCEDSKVIIQISDNGKGISEENLSKIYEPFVSTKSTVKGVGLGLSVSYGIIKAHGGDIVVKSLFGKGSTFSIILPVNGNKNE
jgi:PAS domain S-box-containing protein